MEEVRWTFREVSVIEVREMLRVWMLGAGLRRFATLQLSPGTHFMQVSKWLGHSTFTLTLDTYDYIPEQDGGAANNLPEPPTEAMQTTPGSNVVSLSRR
ncbi:hypothetical protein [Mycobacterium gastri]|nr:hypothetical protein MGAST_03080 [Mycobacterium gastri 'Wayne']